jgi:hypothetical protein
MFGIVIAVLAVCAAVGMLAFKFPFKAAAVSGALLLAAVVLALSSVRTVSSAHIAVVRLFGEVQHQTLNEGIHIVNPLVNLVEVSVGTSVASANNSEAGSRDLQTVHTNLTVNYAVDAKEVRALFLMIPQLNYEAAYIIPAIHEVFKAVVAQYTAEELITKRSEVSTKVRTALDFTNFGFSKAFNDAIEQKVTASQNAEKAERDLARIKFEAAQAIEKAKGEAQAIQIRTQAINSQGGEGFLRLQAIEKWDGKLPTYLSPGAPLPFVSIK